MKLENFQLNSDPDFKLPNIHQSSALSEQIFA